MNLRIWGLWANIIGTLLLLVSGWFETGLGYVEQGLIPHPWVGSFFYWAGLGILLLGFVLQLSAAYGERRRSSLPP